MSDSWEPIIEDYLSSTKAERIRWLSQSLHFVSLEARSTYSPSGDDLKDPERMRRLNELIHRLAQHLSDCMSSHVQRKTPDHEFIKGFVEDAEVVNLRPGSFTR